MIDEIGTQIDRRAIDIADKDSDARRLSEQEQIYTGLATLCAYGIQRRYLGRVAWPLEDDSYRAMPEESAISREVHADLTRERVLRRLLLDRRPRFDLPNETIVARGEAGDAILISPVPFPPITTPPRIGSNARWLSASWARLAELADAGLEYLVLSPLSYDPQQLDIWESKIIRHFR